MPSGCSTHRPDGAIYGITVGMKRMFLFLLTNLAAVAMLTIAATVVCAFCGVNLEEALGEGGYGPLFIYSLVFGMAGSLISLLLSKTMVKASMKCRTIGATGTDHCDTVDVIRSGKLWYNIRHEEAVRKQAQQGVSPDRPDSPQGVLPGCRRAGGWEGQTRMPLT